MAASIVTLVGPTASPAPSTPSLALMRSPLTPAQLLALDEALWLIREEVIRAACQHGARPFASPHEGYGVILEEVDEFWDEVKANNPAAALKEVTQVGAMAAYYITSFAHQVKAPTKGRLSVEAFAKEAANG